MGFTVILSRAWFEEQFFWKAGSTAFHFWVVQTSCTGAPHPPRPQTVPPNFNFSLCTLHRALPIPRSAAQSLPPSERISFEKRNPLRLSLENFITRFARFFIFLFIFFLLSLINFTKSPQLRFPPLRIRYLRKVIPITPGNKYLRFYRMFKNKLPSRLVQLAQNVV